MAGLGGQVTFRAVIPPLPMAPVPAVGVWVWGAAALPECTAREQRKRGGRAAGRKEPMLGKPAGPQPSCALCGVSISALDIRGQAQGPSAVWPFLTQPWKWLSVTPAVLHWSKQSGGGVVDFPPTSGWKVCQGICGRVF